ncbi:hypothetical protein FHR83_005394 [Actinoplanes campanulatus]|uniref:Uncharacterized protein n=1 Tax=Actinoplanes campanulatus TaxID=113559 RepID=A0A7W5AKD2_9ACTN|nr:hypothetical protein [Actinoplanes campanulatus]MBB3097710.1 hypothetical protein [Actinoplanes campanulatus]GGN37900.1 hypothetical protein GCM10010109_64320 [Actinoplanes campanulatus]GID39722.1 hypothetical protein Aca09nite_62280 [Actinoplanes campanulatus]
MTLHYIAIYHNTDTQFRPYQPHHALIKVISHRRHLPAATTPEQIGSWAFHVFNADLDDLQAGRGKTEAGELNFLLACTYRLLRHRSLSVGDVIAITTAEATTWLACDPIGWRRIAIPQHRTGTALSAATVYDHLRHVDDE